MAIVQFNGSQTDCACREGSKESVTARPFEIPACVIQASAVFCPVDQVSLNIMQGGQGFARGRASGAIP